MAIFATMSAMTYITFNQFQRVSEHIEKKSTRLAELQRAFAFMKKDFIQIVPRPVRDEYGSRLPALQSELGDIVQFTRTGWNRPTFLAGIRSELQRVEYRLEEGNLIRSHWRVLDRAEDSVKKDLVLLQKITDLSFKFYYLTDQKDIKDDQQWPPSNATGSIASPGLQDCGIDSENEITLPDVIEITLGIEGFGDIIRKFSVLSGYKKAVVAGCT